MRQGFPLLKNKMNARVWIPFWLFQETDYAFNYFDNGEAYGDDDGDDDEGPVYWYELGRLKFNIESTGWIAIEACRSIFVITYLRVFCYSTGPNKVTLNQSIWKRS